MIAGENPRVKKAVVRLMELSEDERTNMLFESRQKMEWDIWAREQGMRFDIAKDALDMNLSVDDIIKLTGLSKQDIKSIQITS